MKYTDKGCMLLRILVLLLVAISAYIAGIMTDITTSSEMDTKNKVESSVEDYLAYPGTAQYRNMSYHILNRNADGEEIGYFCGEVFEFKDELPYGFKRFIVRTHINKMGKTVVSIPFVEDIGDILLPEEFNSVWSRNCENK